MTLHTLWMRLRAVSPAGSGCACVSFLHGCYSAAELRLIHWEMNGGCYKTSLTPTVCIGFHCHTAVNDCISSAVACKRSSRVRGQEMNSWWGCRMWHFLSSYNNEHTKTTCIYTLILDTILIFFYYIFECYHWISFICESVRLLRLPVTFICFLSSAWMSTSLHLPSQSTFHIHTPQILWSVTSHYSTFPV